MRRPCLATEDPIEAPPLVDINTPPDICIPFELLPLLSFDGPNIETFADLQPAAALLPGFRAIIRRTDATASLPQAANLRGTPKVPFRLFRYGSLEADLFTRLGDVLEVRRPWPEQPLERKRAVRAFGDLIFTAGTSVDSSPDQIQHFACHCEGGAGSGGHPSISLAPAPSDPDKDPDDEIELLLEKLIPGLLNHWTPSLAKPLVFLNACESAAIPTCSILSLPKLFLDNGNPVYIGTECRVPRNVAARLSERFYYHLLKPVIAPTGTGDYQRVGMALHLAKWDLLLLHGNPAGIMYTLYGDPNVGIERATTNGD